MEKYLYTIGKLEGFKFQHDDVANAWSYWSHIGVIFE